MDNQVNKDLIYKESDSSPKSDSKKFHPSRSSDSIREQDSFNQDFVPLYKDQYLKDSHSYKKSPTEIILEASDILSKDFYFDGSAIVVDFKEGALVLKGSVKSRYEKKIAEYMVENINGVFDVKNEIRIIFPKLDGWFSQSGDINDEI